MKRNWRIALGLGLALALAAPAATADEEPAPGDAGQGADVEPGKSKKVLRIVRARRVLDALQAAYDKARAAPEIDEKHLARLEEALEDAKAMTKSITLEELTQNERDALAEELRKLEGGDAKEEAEEPRGGRNDWEQRTLDRAFEDAGLSEEEEAKATPIISEWYGKFMTAWRERDSKTQSDLKRDRDKALKKALGRKKAQKVINNLNSVGGRRW